MNYLSNLGQAQIQSIVGVVVLVIVFGLLFVVWKQRQRIQTLEERQHRVGFLGKQLVPMVIVAIMASGMVGAAAISRNVLTRDGGVSVANPEEVKFRISAQKTFLTSGDAQVALKFVPEVAGVAWGGDRIDLNYDVYWEVTGPNDYYKIELDLTSKKQGGFTLTMPPGQYTIKLNVFKEAQSWVHEERVTI